MILTAGSRFGLGHISSRSCFLTRRYCSGAFIQTKKFSVAALSAQFLKPTMAPSTSNGIVKSFGTGSNSRIQQSLHNKTHAGHFYSTLEKGDGMVETEFLVVGAGPAGAALACFLGQYGW